MGNTIIEQDYPFDILHRGKRDETSHNKRVDKAVRKQLKDIISQQDIITSEGNKKVKVRLKYLDQYRFTHNKDHVDNIGRDEFDELVDGELLHKPTMGNNGKGRAQPGNETGDTLYEAEYTIEELTDMMIQELALPDLDETKKNEIITEVLEWNDRRKKSGVRSLIDKKHTLLANIKRRAMLKTKDKIPIIDDDLRFRTWNVQIEKHSNAVVFLLMDRSGSMFEEKIYAVKALYFWIVQFLRRKYDKVDIKFIAHDYDATELTEKEFFTISDSGGTRISSAYSLCKDMIQRSYPQDIWNIYCFHASDGDSWQDEDECVKLVDEILKLGATLFGYSEIRIGNSDRDMSAIYDKLKIASMKGSRILLSTIEEIDDVLSTLDKFLRYHQKIKK